MTVIQRFAFGGRRVPAVHVESALVELVAPFQRGEFDLVNGSPRTLALTSSVLRRPLIVFDRFSSVTFHWGCQVRPVPGGVVSTLVVERGCHGRAVDGGRLEDLAHQLVRRQCSRTTVWL